jgi:hypothetical protein
MKFPRPGSRYLIDLEVWVEIDVATLSLLLTGARQERVLGCGAGAMDPIRAQRPLHPVLSSTRQTASSTDRDVTLPPDVLTDRPEAPRD